MRVVSHFAGETVKFVSDRFDFVPLPGMIEHLRKEDEEIVCQHPDMKVKPVRLEIGGGQIVEVEWVWLTILYR